MHSFNSLKGTTPHSSIEALKRAHFTSKTDLSRLIYSNLARSRRSHQCTRSDKLITRTDDKHATMTGTGFSKLKDPCNRHKYEKVQDYTILTRHLTLNTLHTHRYPEIPSYRTISLYMMDKKYCRHTQPILTWFTNMASPYYNMINQ